MKYSVSIEKGETNMNKGTQETLSEISRRVKKLSDEEIDDVLGYIGLLEGQKEERGPKRKNIGIDFDGTLCLTDFSKGWQGDLVINGGPVPGAIEFLTQLCEADDEFKVYILSSRSKNKRFGEVLFPWLKRYGLDEKYFDRIHITATKPPLWIYIDDAVYFFQKKWPTLDYLRNFKRWYEKEAEKKEEA